MRIREPTVCCELRERVVDGRDHGPIIAMPIDSVDPLKKAQITQAAGDVVFGLVRG